jgi:hypothetical protein
LKFLSPRKMVFHEASSTCTTNDGTDRVTKTLPSSRSPRRLTPLKRGERRKAPGPAPRRWQASSRALRQYLPCAAQVF